MSSLKQGVGDVPVAGQDDVSPSTDPFIRIRPTKGWVSLNYEELWRYRELFYFLVWRNIKIRYKQTKTATTNTPAAT